ncbi:MAG TPA: cation:proton antiporter, partial [Solirubrobacteraceae bacterium]|nr:cation:proton antiporter [Solirubrobacteraceae bacterium]
MASLDLVLLVAGCLLLGLDMMSEVVRRLWLSVPLVALGVGVLLGPDVLGVIEPAELGDDKKILEGLARVTLALAVVDIALRFDRRTLAQAWRPAARLLVGGMLGMWALTGLSAWLLLDVPLWVGFLIGAILTPTDPVVAATLTSEDIARRNLPLRLRRLLQLESGANDGLAIVLFLLPAIVLSEPSDEAAHWLATAARELGIALGGGVVLG